MKACLRTSEFSLFAFKIAEYILLADIPSDSPSTRKRNVGRCWGLWKTVTHQVIIFHCWLQDIPDYSDTVMNKLSTNWSFGCNADRREVNLILSSKLHLFIIKIIMNVKLMLWEEHTRTFILTQRHKMETILYNIQNHLFEYKQK